MASHGPEAGGFARSRDDLTAPDLQFVVASGPPPLPELGDPTQRAATVIICNIDVKSRGRISLRSADPQARPLIDPGYLSDQADLDVLVAGARRAREIARSRRYLACSLGSSLPGRRLPARATQGQDPS
jgi:choline dehydrogenase